MKIFSKKLPKIYKKIFLVFENSIAIKIKNFILIYKRLLILN